MVALCFFGAPVAHAFVGRPALGRLVVKLRDEVSVQPAPGKAGQAATTGNRSLDALNATFGVQQFAPEFVGASHASKAIAGHDLASYFILQFSDGVDLNAIRAAYAADAAVENAEFDMLMPVSHEPNDLGSQWHLESVTGSDAHLTGGWNHTKGSSSVLLAIADTGVDWQHPDLAANIWSNPGEIAGNGIDDDADGLIDDVRGWDFVSTLTGAWPGEDAVGEDNDPSDFNGHGTHCAGIAAAVTNNNLGVCGVAYNCKILPLRIGGSINDNQAEQGVVLMSAAAQAIDFARRKGAVAINCSWGSSNASGLGAACSTAIAAGMVVCVAAGNDNANAPAYLNSRGDCMDVGATGSGDARASFSNFGAWVDVCAPGVSIYSTYFFHGASGAAQHGYTALSGTSMATPVVTGLVGLVRTLNPGFTALQTRNYIKAGCDNIDMQNPGFVGQLGAGRVNALRMFKDYNLTIPADYPSFDKALTASGAGDTLALRGGDVYTNGWFVTRTQRLVQGGWNSDFTGRDPINNPTIVQRTGVGPVLEFTPIVDNTLIIDGVSFSGGVGRNLSSPLPGTFGGGVLCIDASPVLRNCRIISNSAGDAFTTGGGGGAFFANSSALLQNCTISGNSASQGAGLYVLNSTLSIQGGSIASNTGVGGGSTTAGAGLYLDGGTLTLNGLTIDANNAVQDGGGIYLKTGSLDATGVVCSNNGATGSGGNLRIAGGSAVLRGSELRNGAATFGAGVALASGTSIALQSCLVSGNQASLLGGGIYATAANGALANVTFDANRGVAGGGDAVFASGCPAPWTVRNGLITNHTTAVNAACSFNGAAPQLDYNTFWNNALNVAGGSLGAHDTIENPLYVNQAGGVLALAMNSPALDSGDPLIAFNDPDGTRANRGAFGGPNAVSAAPVPPGGLHAQRLSNPVRNAVTWLAVPPAGLQLYALYRGANAQFVPSASTLVTTVPAGTLAFNDPAGAAADWYKIAAVSTTGASSGFGPASPVTAATDAPPQLPQRFALHSNVPNPFNPTTTLQFDLPVDAWVRVDVVDSKGRVVRQLVDGPRAAGVHHANWNGRDTAGREVASGIYFARFSTASEHAVRKMILVR